jgi:transcriptional regulator with XRE-family HTH domain
MPLQGNLRGCKATDFSGRLRRLALAAGSMNEIAKISRISIASIHSYLHDATVSPSLKTVRQIASSIGVDVGWLAFGLGKEPDLVKLAAGIETQRAERRLRQSA